MRWSWVIDETRGEGTLTITSAAAGLAVALEIVATPESIRLSL
jgi:hypothetical protein